MTSHNAIRDSVVEMSRRVGRHNLDVPEMKTLMERIERSQPGVEFTNLVRQTLAPISHLITVKNIDEIDKNFPDFPLKTIVDKVPVQEQDAVWQALGMTNMLLTTLQMVPPEMLNKIETMTNTMMGAMQNGALNDLFKNMSSVMGNMDDADSDNSGDDMPPPAPRPARKKSGQSKQKEFRDKLC
jgi:hypothetical protein